MFGVKTFGINHDVDLKRQKRFLEKAKQLLLSDPFTEILPRYSRY
jgi:hypothetical protein